MGVYENGGPQKHPPQIVGSPYNEAHIYKDPQEGTPTIVNPPCADLLVASCGIG